jgi:hypothetical protein
MLLATSRANPTNTARESWDLATERFIRASSALSIADEAIAYTATASPARREIRNQLSAIAAAAAARTRVIGVIIILATTVIEGGRWRHTGANKATRSACARTTGAAPAAELEARAGIRAAVTAAAVTVTATHEVHGVVVALVGAGIRLILAAIARTAHARHTALRALGTRQCRTTTILEVLAGGVTRGALCATIRGALGAGFTRGHTFQTLLEVIACLTQLRCELVAVRADLIADGTAQTRICGEVFTALHQLLALRDDVCVVLAELTNGLRGAADICGSGRWFRRRWCGRATREQK